MSEYKPGNIVPESGIYTVTHDRKHFKTHDVTCVKGRRFPTCRDCGMGVRFELRLKPHHIGDHPLFQSPFKAGIDALRKRLKKSPGSQLAEAAHKLGK